MEIRRATIESVVDLRSTVPSCPASRGRGDSLMAWHCFSFPPPPASCAEETGPPFPVPSPPTKLEERGQTPAAFSLYSIGNAGLVLVPLSPRVVCGGRGLARLPAGRGEGGFRLFIDDGLDRGNLSCSLRGASSPCPLLQQSWRRGDKRRTWRRQLPDPLSPREAGEKGILEWREKSAAPLPLYAREGRRL